MTRTRFIAYLFSFAFLAGLLSCTEEVKPTPYTYTKVFTSENSKTWKITKVSLSVTGKADEDIALSTCEGDDRYIFYNNAERLYEVINGKTSCDADEPSTLVSYTWSFSNSGASLNIVIPHFFGNFIIPFIVRKATDKTMELEIFLNQENTISYVFYFESVEKN
jgi:hypothetical protein